MSLGKRYDYENKIFHKYDRESRYAMKRKIMIAAVAAAVIFAVIAILSVLAQTPALI